MVDIFDGLPGIIFDDTLLFIGAIIDKKRAPFLILTIIGIFWNHRLIHFSFLCMLAVRQHREIKKTGKIILSVLLIYFLIFSSIKHTAFSLFLYKYGSCENANLSLQYMEWVNCIWADLPKQSMLGYNSSGLLVSFSENKTHQTITGPFWKLKAIKDTPYNLINYSLQ